MKRPWVSHAKSALVPPYEHSSQQTRAPHPSLDTLAKPISLAPTIFHSLPLYSTLFPIATLFSTALCSPVIPFSLFPLATLRRVPFDEHIPLSLNLTVMAIVSPANPNSGLPLYLLQVSFSPNVLLSSFIGVILLSSARVLGEKRDSAGGGSKWKEARSLCRALMLTRKEGRKRRDVHAFRYARAGEGVSPANGGAG